MQRMMVRDLMVPLEEYATVSEDATLFQAVAALEEAQQRHDQLHYKHRAILVFDKKDQVVGKLSQLDVIRALEPEYKKIDHHLRNTSRYGFSAEFIRSLIDDHGLWKKPMDDLCDKAARFKVKDIMYTPTEGEYVEESATLDKGIHQLVVGRHQSLLVTGGGGDKIVGILRLSDVFGLVCDKIKACEL
jgi:CBS domain containing-hemolysin-like protein